MKVTDLNIIVTGGASGMGRHFSLRLTELGANVAACDVNTDALAVLEQEAKPYKGKLMTVRTDVTKEADVADLVRKTVDAYGSVNGLINNAGIFKDGLLIKKDKKDGSIQKFPLDRWQAVIDVDLTGPFLCTREVAAKMAEMNTKPGVIVNISSVSRHGNMGQSNYSAAKAGLIADTKLWAIELAKAGIRVGAVAPGFIDTPILQGMRPEMLEKLCSGVPLGRVGTPEEIFLGIKFIIECDYFTGRVLDIDGGLVM